MPAIILIPDNFVASTTQYIGQIFSDFSGLISLIVGILLGLLVLEIVVGIIKK